MIIFNYSFCPQDIFCAAGPDLLAVLESMLALDPNRRCTASSALKMPYFANQPYPTPGPMLPLPAAVKEERDRAAGVTTGGQSQAAGSKRKIREGLAESGLAKRLVF